MKKIVVLGLGLAWFSLSIWGNPFAFRPATPSRPFPNLSLQQVGSSLWNQFDVSHSLAASYSTGSLGNALQNAYTTHFALKNPQKLNLNFDFGLVRTQWNTKYSGEGTTYSIQPNLNMQYQLSDNAVIQFHFQGRIPVKDDFGQMP